MPKPPSPSVTTPETPPKPITVEREGVEDRPSPEEIPKSSPRPVAQIPLSPTFNDETTVRNCDGKLCVGDKPLFIKSTGEILLLDRNSNKLTQVDDLIAEQVLEKYRAWAEKVSSKSLPADSKFQLAQRALNFYQKNSN